MTSFVRIFAVGFVVGLAVATAPLALADTGSDWFNAKVAQLQENIRLRNQLEDDLVRSQLALGYTVPESLNSQSKSILARADDSAFDREIENLQRTIMMFAAAQEAR